MKKLPLLTAAVIAAVPTFAQSKIDLPASLIVNAVKDVAVGSRAGVEKIVSAIDVDPAAQYSVIVTLTDDSALDGYDVVARRGDMAIVRLTPAQIEQVAAHPAVKKVSLGVDPKPLMDHARVATGVDDIHAGTALGGTRYDGTGVIAGMMDQGVDINHINFLDADGNPRATALWRIKGANGTVTAYETPDAISGFSTDNSKQTHGTHVLGILAGSYNGPADYSFTNSRGSTQTKKQAAANSAIPFYGVATGAEIAVACGEFTGNNVEIGADLVAKYAKEQGKPCVINVSIGNTIGPHDGTDAESRWFESIGEDAIVCFAAGNDGDAPVSISKTFSASDNTLRSVIGPNAYIDGIVDLWGADDNVYTFTFGILERATGELTYTYTLDRNLEGEAVYITGSRYTVSTYLHDPAFEAAFGSDGAVIISSNIDPANNRYEVQTSLQLGGTGSAYLPVIIVEGTASKHIDGYAYGDAVFSSMGVSGYADGDASCSINGLACGKNIIVVGSYANIDSWPTLSAGKYSYQSKPTVGAISSFSSYGTTFDGRQLPDVCAPGGSIIASYSTPYIIGAGLEESGALVGRYTGKTRNSYWDEMQGTSMASPFAAGIIATWLQADPTLTVDEVRDIISRTATNDDFTAVSPERWGAGKINALAGLKEILGLSGVSDVRADVDDVFITSDGSRSFTINVPGAQHIDAQAYSAAGILTASAVANGDTANLSLDSAAAGVYIIRISTPNGLKTHKVTIK